MIPKNTMYALNRYVGLGIEPGSFLKAVLTNDLYSAITLADEDNKKALCEIVCYCRDRIPYDCWGSQLNYDCWVKRFS